MKKVRVAVLTTFVNLLEAFSLCSVVEAHLKGLLSNGYDTTFVGCDGFQPSGVFASPFLRHWRMPNVQLARDSEALECPSEYRRAVQSVLDRLRGMLATMDVVITHDLVYLPHHLAYNQACRELADEFPHLVWLHFVHSAPEPHRELPAQDPRSVRFRPLPNAVLLYPNAYDAPRLAQQYAMCAQDVKLVPHALDFETMFDLHPLTRALIRQYDLYAPDVLAIYPIRMDRGKQPEKLVRLFAEIKKLGKSVRLLVINFHSTGEHFIVYREEILQEARALGLEQDEVIFTNRIPALPTVREADLEHYRIEFPRKVVSDLFRLTNVYIHPSASETYSLVCQEAAAAGNILFLNDDFPPMREIYSQDVHYIKFSSTLFTTTYHPSEQAYYGDMARKLIAALESERTIRQKTRIRQTRNVQAVFKQYLEPLLQRNS